MRRFRSKNVIITAEQYIASERTCPSGVCHCQIAGETTRRAHVHAADGNGHSFIRDGDWIANSEDGPYPISPGVFDKRWELIVEPDGAIDHAGLDSEDSVRVTKVWRATLAGLLMAMKPAIRIHDSRELSLAITKAEEARMWLGMELKRLNDGVSCYPHGNDVDSSVVEPPAP